MAYVERQMVEGWKQKIREDLETLTHVSKIWSCEECR